MKKSELTKRIGQRILSEANDLKRTLETVSQDISVSLDTLNSLIEGKLDSRVAFDIAQKFSKVYPVKVSDILLDFENSSERVIFSKNSESKASSRVYSRLNRDGVATEYYEYRDAAISKLSPFRPEWIKELRIVDNNDPNNPDVAYNNGHLMHQMTTFVGPVNFYWEVNGKKFCKEMNTGDSNFITPFWKHSFTSRDKSKEAYIVAVTFSGDVGRARNELYALGEESIQKFCFDNIDYNNAVTQVIRQVMDDQLLCPEKLQEIFQKKQLSINVDDLLNESIEKNQKSLDSFCKVLDLPLDIFNLPINDTQDEVIVKNHDSEESYFYNNKFKDYKLNVLAKNPRMPECLGFNLQVFSKDQSKSSELNSALHNFIYNYGEHPVNFSWLDENSWKHKTIDPGDSIYMYPHVTHKMWANKSAIASLFLFRVPGYVNLSVQKELSSFANVDRIIETSPWFN